MSFFKQTCFSNEHEKLKENYEMCIEIQTTYKLYQSKYTNENIPHWTIQLNLY